MWLVDSTVSRYMRAEPFQSGHCTSACCTEKPAPTTCLLYTVHSPPTTWLWCIPHSCLNLRGFVTDNWCSFSFSCSLSHSLSFSVTLSDKQINLFFFFFFKSLHRKLQHSWEKIWLEGQTTYTLNPGFPLGHTWGQQVLGQVCGSLTHSW